MKTFSLDPDCRKRVPLVDGRQLSALEIQEVYLDAVESRLSQGSLPPWAEHVCREWRDTLQLLADRPSKTSRRLDWAIKHEVFGQLIRSRGLSWECGRIWTDCLLELEKNRPGAGRRILGAPKLANKLLTDIWKLGLDDDEISSFSRLRAELFELDLRFGQLGREGLFETLDAAGELDHRLPGDESEPLPTTTPPSTGRAKLRGLSIKKYAKNRDRYRCHWARIVDVRSQRALEMPDPFLEGATWQQASRDAEHVLRPWRSGQGLPG